MSKANNSKRKKLLTNVFHSSLSPADKMIYYAMHLKYVDGEQLLEYLESKPTLEQITEYVEEKLRENRVKKHGKEETTS